MLILYWHYKILLARTSLHLLVTSVQACEVVPGQGPHSRSGRPDVGNGQQIDRRPWPMTWAALPCLVSHADKTELFGACLQSSDWGKGSTTRLVVYLSIYLPIYTYSYLSISICSLSMNLSLAVYLSIYLPISSLSMNLSMYLSALYLSIYICLVAWLTMTAPTAMARRRTHRGVILERRIPSVWPGRCFGESFCLHHHGARLSTTRAQSIS